MPCASQAIGFTRSLWPPARRGARPSAARAPAGPVGCLMTLPVSPSGRDLLGSLLGERDRGSVPGGVVGDAVEPAAGDDADPGAGEDADGVGVVFARRAGIVVDLGGL